MKNKFATAIILSATIFSMVTQGAPTDHLIQPLSNTLLQRANECPPCWDGTSSGCKAKSYITGQASDDDISLYYTCSGDQLTTYYTCGGGCYGDGICDNGQLYEYYAYKLIILEGNQTPCAWTEVETVIETVG